MNEEKDLRISSALIKWYNNNKRELPWRETTDPYIIWISEIILQQTRVSQGFDYFVRFTTKFPTVAALANAKEDEIMKLWQGLGYYSRARNLHATAKIIMNEYNSIFPRHYKDILTLKGIGEYTAAAIASFAFNEPYAVVDGNVYRVLSRIFAIDEPIDTSTGIKTFKQLAQSLLNENEPGLHNQAIMEFGALQCVPVSPDCNSCPLSILCLAYARNRVKLYPVKKGKTKVRSRYFHYFDISSGDHTYLHKRTAKDIWQNLYELPLIETEEDIAIEELLNTDAFRGLFPFKEDISLKQVVRLKHVLSHQIIYAVFYRISLPFKDIELDDNLIKIKKKDADLYPVSRLVHKYLEQYK